MACQRNGHAANVARVAGESVVSVPARPEKDPNGKTASARIAQTIASKNRQPDCEAGAVGVSESLAAVAVEFGRARVASFRRLRFQPLFRFRLPV